MALNPQRVGYCYPPYRYEVCREKVREYAVATGLDESPYREKGGETVVPPTFAACFTLNYGWDGMREDAELGAHDRLLHAAQEFAFHRPVRIGDVLECSPWIVSIATRGRHELLTLQVDCTAVASQQPVLTSRATIVFLDSAPSRA